jgi:hypothetical protein
MSSRVVPSAVPNYSMAIRNQHSLRNINLVTHSESSLYFIMPQELPLSLLIQKLYYGV